MGYRNVAEYSAIQLSPDRPAEGLSVLDCGHRIARMGTEIPQRVEKSHLAGLAPGGSSVPSGHTHCLVMGLMGQSGRWSMMATRVPPASTGHPLNRVRSACQSTAHFA